MKRTVILALVFVVGVFAPLWGQQPSTNSIIFRHSNGYHYITFSENRFSVLAGSYDDGSPFFISGTWSISGDRLTLNMPEGFDTVNFEIFYYGNQNTQIRDPEEGVFWNRTTEEGNINEERFSWWEPDRRYENFLQVHRIFIERVGQVNADVFPESRFKWNNANETLTYRSQAINFTGTDWGLLHSPITFYKEMEVRFRGRNIISAQWRYVYLEADSWFGVGNPSLGNPVYSNWFTTAVTNNNVRGSGFDGVINTLIYFGGLRVNSEYTFRRGNGSNTTLTVRDILG